MNRIVETFTRKPVIFASLVFVIAVAVRLYHLDMKAFWLDEAVIYWISQAGSLSGILQANAAQNSAPPLFVLLLGGISHISTAEFFLKLLPCLAGCASVFVIWLLGREFMSDHAATFVALLTALSTAHLRYSQLLREYSLSFLLATLMLLFFVRYLKTSSNRHLTVFSLVSLIGIFTQYGLALLLFSLNLVFFYELVRDKDMRSRIRPWIISQTVCGAGAVCIVLVSLLDQMPSGEGFGDYYLSHAYGHGTLSSWILLALGGTLHLLRFADPALQHGELPPGLLQQADFAHPILFVTIVIAGTGIVLSVQRFRRAGIIFLAPVVVTYLFAALQLYPYHGDRQTIFLLPMFYVIVGAFLEYLWCKDNHSRYIALVFGSMLVLAASISVWSFHQWPGREQIKPAIEILNERYEDGDRIYVFCSALPAFMYYCPEHEDAMIRGVRSRRNIEGYFPQVRDMLSRPGRVWMVFSHDLYQESGGIMEEVARTGRTVHPLWNADEVELYLVDR